MAAHAPHNQEHDHTCGQDCQAEQPNEGWDPPPEKVQPSEKYLHAYRVSTPMKKKYASSQEAAYDANTSPAIFNFAISIVLGLVA